MMRFPDECDLRDRDGSSGWPHLSPDRRPAAPRLPAIDFARLVGARGWRRLPAAIRRRFGHHPGNDAGARYVGTMHEVECSAAGFLLAQFCRLLGTPLAPWRGSDIPVTIALQPDPASGGMVWERLYRYPGRAPIRVRSVKQLSPDGGLLECVGGGFGMRLAVFERGGALHFASLFYFWRIGGLTLRLPDLLTPGAAHVVHHELGGGRFRFIMTMRHKILGTTVRQDGVFRREGDET
jgi:hypothetical protein